jgi:hypothetical protein
MGPDELQDLYSKAAHEMLEEEADKMTEVVTGRGRGSTSDEDVSDVDDDDEGAGALRPRHQTSLHGPAHCPSLAPGAWVP